MHLLIYYSNTSLSRYTILEKAAAKENEKNIFTSVRSGQNYGSLSDMPSEIINGKWIVFYNKSIFYLKTVIIINKILKIITYNVNR